jgi:hypothetical protein
MMLAPCIERRDRAVGWRGGPVWVLRQRADVAARGCAESAASNRPSNTPTRRRARRPGAEDKETALFRGCRCRSARRGSLRRMRPVVRIHSGAFPLHQPAPLLTVRVFFLSAVASARHFSAFVCQSPRFASLSCGHQSRVSVHVAGEVHGRREVARYADSSERMPVGCRRSRAGYCCPEALEPADRKVRWRCRSG